MNRELRWVIWSGAALLAAAGGLLAFRHAGPPSPPPLSVIRTLGDFTVTNQSGITLNRSDLQGRPWAIDLIFTRCPGPCARLSGVMSSIQRRLPPDSRAGLLSVTSDPDYDTPAVLRSYGGKFGADTNRWQFVTGSTPMIRQLATHELLLVLQPKAEAERSSPDDLFLHSTRIVMVDPEGRLRASVDGLEPGAADRVLAVLRQLEAGG